MSQEPRDTHEDEEEDEEEDYESTSRDANTPELNFKALSKDAMSELNDRAALKIRQQKQKEAILILQQAERMLEFAASCGRAIDRNLIVVVLYNEACAYQCQWVLDKCSKYLDGVIYNMELSLEEEVDAKECQALLVKRYTFLSRCYLQFCAILSQLGKHQSALENARKAAQTMRQLFRVAYEFCKDYRRRAEGSANSSQNSSKPQRAFSQKQSSQKDNSESTLSGDSSQRPIFYMKDEVTFAKLVVEQGFDMLRDMSNQRAMEEMTINEKEQFNEAKKQLYYWRNNPENNEKHLRKELKVPQSPKSLLGIQNVQEWIENFNIGSIMHMVPLNYEEFSSYGEMIYEISKRILLEKIIYLSISYFTIATEFRFVEIEKAKQSGINDKDIQTEEFKISELYHLKAIEIACKYITCSSPYINHLITSYHKHYNQNLDTIVIWGSRENIRQPEESFHSQIDNQSEVQLKEDRMLKLKKSQEESSKKLEQHSEVLLQSEGRLQVLEKSGSGSEQVLQSEKLGSKQLPMQSPTSKLLHSFMNQQPPPAPVKTNSETRSNNVILEQMLKPSGSYKGTMGLLQKQQQYFYQQQLYEHSPSGSRAGKRDSSPTIRNNTVPALTFLQNAMLYNQQQQQGQQSQQLQKERQNASATNQSLESSMVGTMTKKADTNSSLTIQPQPYRSSYLSNKTIAQVYGQGQVKAPATKNPLNTLLATQKQPQTAGKASGESSQSQQGKMIESQNLFIEGYMSYRQSGSNEQCRTERSKEFVEPRIQSQQNSRSPERGSQVQSSRQVKKPATQPAPRITAKPRTQPNQKDLSIPIRLETIQQLLKNNSQLMNYTKAKMK